MPHGPRSSARSYDPKMSDDSTIVAVLGVIAGYNVIQNELLPEWAYVPANLAVTAGLVLYARQHGTTFDDMGLGVGRLRDGLMTGVTMALAVAAGTAAVSRTRFRRLFEDERARGHGRREAVYRSVVRFPLGTALFEEVAFRAVLDASWRRRKPQSARVATSLAFGAWHLLPTYRLYPGMAPGRHRAPTAIERAAASIVGALVTAAAGCGLALLRERTGSVVAPWLAHAAHNTSAYVMARHVWSRS